MHSFVWQWLENQESQNLVREHLITPRNICKYCDFTMEIKLLGTLAYDENVQRKYKIDGMSPFNYYYVNKFMLITVSGP